MSLVGFVPALNSSLDGMPLEHTTGIQTVLNTEGGRLGMQPRNKRSSDTSMNAKEVHPLQQMQLQLWEELQPKKRGKRTAAQTVNSTLSVAGTRTALTVTSSKKTPKTLSDKVREARLKAQLRLVLPRNLGGLDNHPPPY